MGGGKEGDGERRTFKLGDGDNAASSVALFASSTGTIFTIIAFNWSIKANATSTLVFVSMGAYAMVASIGSAHRDDNCKSSRSVLRSAVERKDYATTGLWGATHGDGNDEPNSDANRSTTEPIDQNPS
jgi:hypothetical protein